LIPALAEMIPALAKIFSGNVNINPATVNIAPAFAKTNPAGSFPRCEFPARELHLRTPLSPLALRARIPALLWNFA